MEVNSDILVDAAGRNLGVVLFIQLDGHRRRYRSRFLASDEQGIWFEAMRGLDAAMSHLAAEASPCEVAFRMGTRQIKFTSPVLRSEREYQFNQTVRLPAICLQWPDVVQAVQRRSGYRTAVTPFAGVQMRLWRIITAMTAIGELSQPPVELPLAGQLRNISVGGITVTMDIPPGDAVLRIELTSDETGVLLLEGKIKYTELMEDQSQRCGIQFIWSDDRAERQRIGQVLEKLIGRLQRLELRRAK